VKLHLTQLQYDILLALSTTITSVLTGAQSGASQYDPYQSTLAPVALKAEEENRMKPPSQESVSSSGQTTTDLVVFIGAITLHLYDGSATSRDGLREHGIARMALLNNSLRLKTLDNGSTETQLVLQSLTVTNTRPGSSRFREIVPPAQHDRNQFMVLYTTPTNSEDASVAVVTIDAPQIIFSIDPLIALINFFSHMEPNDSAGTLEGGDGEGSSFEDAHSGYKPPEKGGLNFRLELHDLSLSILENDSNPDTRSIRLLVHHILVSKQVRMSIFIWWLVLRDVFRRLPHCQWSAWACL
jgi:vacuolar protein sorting-associated protein 13A/C